MVLLGALIGEEVSLLLPIFCSLLFFVILFLLLFPLLSPRLLLFLFFSFTCSSFLPLLVKVPQIVKILSASSVENLSYLANILELAAVTFTSTYSYAKGFPFR